MRHFTLEEANALLSRVRPLVERMVEERRSLAAVERRRLELVTRIAGNGGDLAPGELADLEGAMTRGAAALASVVDEIQSLGVQVKDLEIGLVDFPSLRDNEEILLCWRLGEEEIAFWHGADEGYVGRKPI